MNLIKVLGLVLFVSLIGVSTLHADEGIDTQINISNNTGFFSDLVKVYNQLIDVTRDTIKDNMDKVVAPATKLLGSLALVYIIVMAGKSFITGQYFLSDLMIKMLLFVVLSTLLSFNWYDKYIVSNLEIAFNELPTVFGTNGSSDIISNIIEENSKFAEKIWTSLESQSWSAKIIGYIIAAVAILALGLLTAVVIINILFATVKFYIVLSLSSILILFYFFKATRSYVMGAVQIVIGAIINITLLSMFLELFATVIEKSLTFNVENDFFSSCLSVVIVSFLGVSLIKVINEIAQVITAQAINTGGSIASLGSKVGSAFENIKSNFKG